VIDSKIAFVYGKNSEDVVEVAKKHKLAENLLFVPLNEFLKDPKSYTVNEKIIISADVSEIKGLIQKGANECDFSLAIVARKDQNALRDSFHLSQNIDENITQALECEPKEIDMLYCNGEIALYSVQIGDTPPLSYSTLSYEKKSLKERFISFVDIFKKFKNLHHTKITIKTKKEQVIETVASGMVVVEHDNRTFASSIIADKLKINDSKLSALIISPPSVVGYLGFLLKSMFLKVKKDRLPNHVGYIESSTLEIKSEKSLDLRIDGELKGTTPAFMEVIPKAIKICLPKSFWKMEANPSDKESIRLGTLPLSKDIVNYQEQKLPLFTHASEEQYQTLFVSLREEAKASSTFMTLILLSTLLATVGLYLNSSSVIIGAMLLAPLMQPIVSFSMGVLRRSQSIFSESLKTIAIGVAIALVSSALFALIMPFETLTNEMQGRLRPSIMDLIVALISGTAAAYAKNNEKIVGSLVGVSIAVALVPPIAVAGIGLGWMNFDMFYHAFLLFLTNFAGIVFAASMLFFMQGFSPISGGAKRGLLYSLISAVLISIPLYLSFESIKEDANIKRDLMDKRYLIDDLSVKIEAVQTSHIGDELHIRCDLLVHSILNDSQKRELKKEIEIELDKEVILEAVQRIIF
jgi:uncharacterized hydrophobic protein (TIGR00271 family)